MPLEYAQDALGGGNARRTVWWKDEFFLVAVRYLEKDDDNNI
jgi:hypothetical protein